jgi:hypothetical protein
MKIITNYRKEYDNVKVLYGNKVFHTESFKTTNLNEVLNSIASDQELQKLIEKVRSVKSTKERQEYKKNNLPFFVIGEFKDNIRQKVKFIRTQYAIFDYDHLSDNYETHWNSIISNTNVFAAFRSPSGDGIKVVYKFDKAIENSDEFSAIYKYYASQFEIDLGEQPDKTSDCSRACFFSYDTDMYVNSDAKPLNTDFDLSEILPTSNKADKEQFLDKIKNGVKAGGPRTPVLVSAVGILLKNGIDREHALAFASGWNKLNEEPHDESKITYTVNDIYDRYSSQSISEKTKDFYSHETSIFEARMIGDEFSIKKIGEKKFGIKMDAKDKEEKERYVSHVVKNNDLHTLRRIDYISDMTSEISFYQYFCKEGIFTAHIKPIAVNVKDNDFIEDYLDSLFGNYKSFIKQWLAIYVYTNYKKLPHLILTGGRGTSKSTFTDMVSSIFPTLSSYTKELEGNFNPDAEKKLVVIDESDSKGKIQYRTLKKYSGQRFTQVNKKYLPQYQVRNNLNIIILSNDEDAIYVEREEAPTDEKNNQFFVYKFKPFSGPIDPEYVKKLIDRIGHYIRTELKTVYESINPEGYRYSIPVPITEEEKLLFQNSITEVEADADLLIQKLILHGEQIDYTYREYLLKGYIPAEFFSGWTIKSPKHKVIKDLQRRGYLKKEKSDRYIQVDGKRPYCYKLGSKWINKINLSRGNKNGYKK